MSPLSVSEVRVRLLRRLLPIVALALASAAPSAVSAAEVDRTPGVQAVTPASGPLAGGNQVQVSTRSSSGAVLFGGKPATVTQTAVGDDFENGIAYYYYTVVVPTGTALGKVDVTVGGTGGTSETSNDYTYVDPNAPAPGVDRVLGAPKGPAAGGNRVTVLVFGDVGQDSLLWFGGQPGTAPIVAPNGISCIPEDPNPCPIADPAKTGWLVSAIAPAAPAGQVDLSVRRGTTVLAGRTPTSDDYTYEAPPVPVNAPKVTGISGSPLAGVGGLVTLSGTNLGGLRSVKIGTRAATVLYSTATQVYVWAPAQARGSYTVTLTTRVGTATAPKMLVYRNLF